MAKSVFRSFELKDDKKDVVTLKLFRDYSPAEEVVEEAEIPEYTGPTADDLRREAEEFKKNWEAEKQKMFDDAQTRADEIVQKAEAAAFAEVKRQTDQAQVLKADAEKSARQIQQDAQEKAQQMIADAQEEVNKIRADALKQGMAEGREAGYADGSAEAARLVERMHKVIEAVMQRRQEILDETEHQIVELVILSVRKIVKTISENQKSVILSNVLSALKKVKGRGDITIRVNLEDVKLTTEHMKDFIQHVEGVKGITVLEDSSVERGGCIVGTDFGAIDARISSQLAELEEKILEISPIKSVSKSDVVEQ